MRRLPVVGVVTCAVVLLAGAAGAQAFPLSQDGDIIRSAVSYMISNQNRDGGFGLNGKSDLSTTARVIVALCSAGVDPMKVRVEGRGPLEYLESVSKQAYAGNLSGNRLADIVNMIIAVSKMGIDPSNFSGMNFVDAVLEQQNKTTGRFGQGPLDTAYAVLALRSAGLSTYDQSLLKATDYLKQAQLADGSFEYAPGWGSDSNSVSLAIMALHQTASSTGCVARALDALKSFQNSTNGGFFYQSMWGTKPDVSSTALAIQAIVSSGQDPTSDPWAKGAVNPVSYLLSTQNVTTGEFYDPYGSLRPTALAVTALVGSTVAQISEATVLATLMSVALLALAVHGRAGTRVG